MRTQYKGYTARVEFDQDAGVLFGEVDGLRDVVTFETDDVKDLERAFRASVDDYLAMCAERTEEPERPYSGRFLVRLEPALHREVAKAAARTGRSLNAFVSELLASCVAGATDRRTRRVVPGPNASPLDARITLHEPATTPVEVRGTPGGAWGQPWRQDTPASKTPDTPAGSRTPQEYQEKVA